MSDVECHPSSHRLQDCTFTVNSPGCSHEEHDVGLTCSLCSQYICADGECTDAVACNGVKECMDGSDEDTNSCGSKLIGIHMCKVKVKWLVVLL